MSTLRILHTNDMHGYLTEGLADRLGEVRSEHDLYFDSGDAVKAGNLAVPLREEPVWARLNALRCTASVLGNRETHVLESAFRAKLAGATHPLLAGNLRRPDGTPVLPRTLVLEAAGFKVGVISTMVAMVTDRMATRHASAYRWDPPVPTAIELAKSLRPQVDVLIALTHIGIRQDIELAEHCPEVDIILGGHSHTVFQTPQRHGRTWIAHGGSHCRYYGSYVWDGETLSGALVPLRPEVPQSASSK